MHAIKPSECQDALGMESGAISDAQISASSFHDNNDKYAAYHGRLHLQENKSRSGAWSAGKNDDNQSLQIDLIGKHRVTGVATQGRDRVNQWVTEYTLQYSNDSLNFHDYTEDGENAIKVKYSTN